MSDETVSDRGVVPPPPELLEPVSCDRFPYGCGLGDDVPVFRVVEQPQ